MAKNNRLPKRIKDILQSSEPALLLYSQKITRLKWIDIIICILVLITIILACFDVSLYY
jgi:hypothetical protein